MELDKIKQINEIINEEGLSAVILWRPDELVMALGYQPYLGLSVAVFYEDGEQVLYIPEKEPKHLLPDSIKIETISWGMSDTPWEQCLGMIKQKLSSFQCQKPIGFIKAIGHTSPTIVGGECPPLPSDFITRLERLNVAGYKEVDEKLMGLYACKDERAIKGIKKAHEVAALGIKAFYENLQAGKSEVDVKIAIESAIMEAMKDCSIHFSRGWAQVQAGENSKASGDYNITTYNILKEGDLVMLELGVCVNGYWCDLSRTGVVGTVTAKQKQDYKVILEAQQAALSLVKAGAKNVELYEAAMKKIAEKGYAHLFKHELGHGVGYRYHDPHAPLAPYSGEATLKEGMVITVEPGIYGDEIGGGIRVEDNVLVTKDGYELLSVVPRGLKGE